MFEIAMLIAFVAAAFSQLLPEKPQGDHSDQGTAVAGCCELHQRHAPGAPATQFSSGLHQVRSIAHRSHLQIRTRMLL